MKFTKFTPQKVLMMPAAVFAIAITVPAFAQTGNPTASEQSYPAASEQTGRPTAGESMHRAGESAEDSATSAGDAVEHAYHGSKTALKDSVITAKVKARLAASDVVDAHRVHVSTSAGIVTLRGRVPSPVAASKAEEIAINTEGVREVRNNLEVMHPRDTM